MRILFWIFSLLATSGFSQSATLNFTIQDFDSKQSLKALIAGHDGSLIEKTDVVNGKFTFEQKIDYPTLFLVAVVTPDEEPVFDIRFFAEPGEADIILESKHKTYKTVTTNSVSQNKFEEFYKQYRPLVLLWQQSAKETYNERLSEKEINIHRGVLANIDALRQEVALNFIIQNTNNAVGGYVFLFYFIKNAKPSLQDSVYALFSPDIQNTKYLKEAKSLISSRNNVEIGKSAPVFSAITSNQKKISLTDLKGKYIVLDFWGSWCEPCIIGFPSMKQYYNTYKHKVEFVGIACKDTPQTWAKALEKHQLPWINILNHKDEDDLITKYQIESFPTKVVIDPNGKVVAVFQGEGQDFYKKLDELFK